MEKGLHARHIVELLIRVELSAEKWLHYGMAALTTV